MCPWLSGEGVLLVVVVVAVFPIALFLKCHQLIFAVLPFNGISDFSTSSPGPQPVAFGFP